MKKTTTGFTLVELLIVIVVIAILAAISIVAYTGIQNRAHDSAIQSDLRSNATKLQQYYVLNDAYPVSQPDFRSAGLSFTKNSYRHAAYCVSDNGSPDAAFAFVVRSQSNAVIVYHSAEGFSAPVIVWSNTDTVCGDGVGMPAPNRNIGAWLRGSGDWIAAWVP